MHFKHLRMLSNLLSKFTTFHFMKHKHIFLGCMEHNITYEGELINQEGRNDIIYERTNSPEKCQMLCEKRSECRYWVWNKATKQNRPNACNMMNKIVGRAVNDTTISGEKNYCTTGNV